jgi:hypothetical protein
LQVEVFKIVVQEQNTQGEEPEATKSAMKQDEELGPNRAQVRTPAKAKVCICMKLNLTHFNLVCFM